MIEREFSEDGTLGRYVLRPHRSATWNENLVLVACIAGTAVPIAVAWAIAGFWPILPLCGLELVFLTCMLYAANHALLAQEVVTVERDSITIEAGRRQVERRFDLRRPWARIGLEPTHRRSHPDRLILRSHGRAVELGRFLDEDERAELADDLGCLLTLQPRRSDAERG